MFSAVRIIGAALALPGLLAPLGAFAATIASEPFAFVERRTATDFWSEGQTFVVGSTSVLAGGSGLSVTATHVPLGSGPDYSLGFVPSPFFPNQYAFREAYAGQAGQWLVTATDSSGSTARVTHTLDDVKLLPFLTGLTISGSPLAPHIAWNAVDTSLFPAFCISPCLPGDDFFSYQVEVRSIPDTPGTFLPTVWQSANIQTTGFGGVANPTGINIPAGVLLPGNDYLIGLRLNQVELEGFGPGGSFITALENRSTVFAMHVAAIPEPQTYALMLAGLALLGFISARRNPRTA